MASSYPLYLYLGLERHSMLIPEIPENESARLAALRAMKVLDTPAENYLDHIAEVAGHF